MKGMKQGKAQQVFIAKTSLKACAIAVRLVHVAGIAT